MSDGLRIFDVSGTFLPPGSREKRSLSKTRVLAISRQEASKDLALMLNDKFGRDLGEKLKFGDSFALMNLQWHEPAIAPIPPTQLTIAELGRVVAASQAARAFKSRQREERQKGKPKVEKPDNKDYKRKGIEVWHGIKRSASMMNGAELAQMADKTTV